MRSVRTIALICCLALITACATKPQAKEQPPSPPDGFVTLTFSAYRNPVFDVLINAFQEKHPTIRVSLIQPPIESMTSIEASINWMKEQVSSGASDVILDINLIQLDQGLLNLDPYVQKTAFDLKPYGSLDKLRQNGKLNVLPMERTLEVLVYNKDLFAAANVAPPKAGWTWDDFRQAAQQIAKPGKTWGFVAAQPHMLASLYAGAGGKSEDFRQGVGFTAQLIAVDKSMPAPPKNPMEPMSETPFLNGQVGMALVFPGTLRRDVRANWDYAPLPTRPGHPAQPFVTAQVIGIPEQSKHPKEAWELVQFLSGQEGSSLAAKQGILFCYMTPAVRDAWFSQSPPPSPNSEFLFTEQWAPVWLEPQPKLSPAAASAAAALQMKSDQALRLAFADGSQWEAHYAEFDQLQQQMLSLSQRP